MPNKETPIQKEAKPVFLQRNLHILMTLTKRHLKMIFANHIRMMYTLMVLHSLLKRSGNHHGRKNAERTLQSQHGPSGQGASSSSQIHHRWLDDVRTSCHIHNHRLLADKLPDCGRQGKRNQQGLCLLSDQQECPDHFLFPL